jgi:DHA2 family lincomycin resistance protein-like MFS transporter
MMPGQTNGLNELPKNLYPHGTAIINTLFQVGGAIGVALFINIMETKTAAEMKSFGTSQPSPAQTTDALVSGIQSAFTVGLLLSILCFIIALFIKPVKPPVEH